MQQQYGILSEIGNLLNEKNILLIQKKWRSLPFFPDTEANKSINDRIFRAFVDEQPTLQACVPYFLGYGLHGFRRLVERVLLTKSPLFIKSFFSNHLRPSVSSGREKDPSKETKYEDAICVQGKWYKVVFLVQQRLTKIVTIHELSHGQLQSMHRLMKTA